MLNLNHLPPYYGPRMQTRMRERSQKYACRGTSLDIRAYARALARAAVEKLSEECRCRACTGAGLVEYPPRAWLLRLRRSVG